MLEANGYRCLKLLRTRLRNFRVGVRRVVKGARLTSDPLIPTEKLE
jgi:hypothetical protein